MKPSLTPERTGLFGIKSRMYKVIIDGNMKIIEASSIKEAKQITVDDMDIKIDLATKDDIEWYGAMAGYEKDNDGFCRL